MAQLAGRAITAQIPVVPCFDNNRYFTLRSRVFPSVSLRDGAMLTSIATEQKYMSDSSATLRNTIDRLRSFIQYDYSIGLRGLVGSRTASPPALYQIG